MFTNLKTIANNQIFRPYIMIQNITYKNKTLALIIRNKYLKKKGINFFTDNKLSQQVAYMNHKKGHIIQPHIHKRRLKNLILFFLISFYS